MVKLTINGRNVKAREGVTILEAAKSAGIEIPTLCYWKDLNQIGACRICSVQVEGYDRLVASCNEEALDGMVVYTNTPKVIAARRLNLQLILSQHNASCTECERNSNCVLQNLANKFNITDVPYAIKTESSTTDSRSPLVRNADKCVKCMRCIQVCDNVQTLGVWSFIGTGSRATVGPSQNKPLVQTNCTFCGQCVTHCPVGALVERDDTARALDFLADPDVVTVVQVAPAVRAAWAEEFGLSAEWGTPGRLAAALKGVGFDYVFDTNFGADLTIMEEANEFIKRFSDKENFSAPMFTSCCPGWVRFLKSQFPEYTDNLSTAKSPQQMFGAIAKSFFAEQKKLDPHKIRVISIMPCVAKKAECELEPLRDACGDPDVDLVLTTREAIRLFKTVGLDVRNLSEADFDDPLGASTGAAVIFGATGGVMDAALRSAYFFITGENPSPDAFVEIRGVSPWKEAVFTIPGVGDVKVAVVSGLGNTRKLLTALKNGEVSYDFVEVMACPGGCAGGGGQPIFDQEERMESRGALLWRLDSQMQTRFSHENESIQTLYRDYLGNPLGEKSHRLLHTNHHDWKTPSVD